MPPSLPPSLRPFWTPVKSTTSTPKSTASTATEHGFDGDRDGLRRRQRSVKSSTATAKSSMGEEFNGEGDGLREVSGGRRRTRTTPTPTPTTPPPHEYDAEADHDADRDADQDFRGSVVAGLPICEAMLGIGRSLHRQMHTFARNGPSETLRRKVAELEKLRRKRNLKRTELFVEVPESRSYLDTATMPMIAVAVGGALFPKLLMMYDDSKSQEMIERKIQHAPVGQGTVRMLSREEWEGIKEQRPRTPFESKLARPIARIRTGEPLHMEDLKDWTSDVFADALTRAEETAKHRSN